MESSHTKKIMKAQRTIFGCFLLEPAKFLPSVGMHYNSSRSLQVFEQCPLVCNIASTQYIKRSFTTVNVIQILCSPVHC